MIGTETNEVISSTQFLGMYLKYIKKFRGTNSIEFKWVKVF